MSFEFKPFGHYMTRTTHTNKQRCTESIGRAVTPLSGHKALLGGVSHSVALSAERSSAVVC